MSAGAHRPRETTPSNFIWSCAILDLGFPARFSTGFSIPFSRPRRPEQVWGWRLCIELWKHMTAPSPQQTTPKAGQGLKSGSSEGETMARILIVDDTEMMRDSLAATLAR